MSALWFGLSLRKYDLGNSRCQSHVTNKKMPEIRRDADTYNQCRSRLCDSAGACILANHFYVLNGVSGDWFVHERVLEYKSILRERRVGLGLAQRKGGIPAAGFMGDRVVYVPLVDRTCASSAALTWYVLEVGAHLQNQRELGCALWGSQRLFSAPGACAGRGLVELRSRLEIETTAIANDLETKDPRRSI